MGTAGLHMYSVFKSIVQVAAWLGLSCQVLGLDPSHSVYQSNPQNWTRADGLPVNGVNAIVQTRDGYLWLGTHNGLVRFDGIEFVPVKMPGVRDLRSVVVRCMMPDPHGGLWFGLEDSAYGFHNGNEYWSFCTDTGGAKNCDVRALVQGPDGRLMVAGSGLSGWRMGDGRIQSIFGELPEDARINASTACAGSDGRIWLGTASQGLYCWEKGKVTKVPDPALDLEIIFAIAEDQAGQLWLGTPTGLRCYDSQLQRKAIDFPENQVNALLVDRQGSLWIGMADSGVARWREGHLEILRKSDGLVGDSVLCLAEDREGSLWIGCREGLSQLLDVKFPTFTEREGMFGRSKLSVSASPRGGLWAACDDGVTYYMGWGVHYGAEAGLRKAYAKRVFEANDGDLYVISGRNEIEIMADGKVVARQVTPKMPVAMAEDEQGVIVSVAGELYRVGRDYFIPYPFDGEPPLLYWVLNLMTARDGALWVACGNGICRIQDGKFQQWTAQDAAEDYAFRWVCEDDTGTVWAGTSSGIARVKDGQIRFIRGERGLYDANIYAMIPDDRGQLWVDSARGLYRVSLRSLNNFADGIAGRVECVAYDRPSAVKPADRYGQEHSGCKTSDGRIWFPSQKGLIMIDPAHVPTNRVAPYVHAYLRTPGMDRALTNLVVLPPGKGELEFSYAATTFIDAPAVRYRYRLEGLDQDWVEAGNRRVAYYPNLKPGHYTFHVIADNADGVWSVEGDSLEVELAPHFYQTAWFSVAGLCGGVFSLGGVYGWRVRHLRRKQGILQEQNEALESRIAARTCELGEQRNLLRTLIDHLPDSIFVKDLESRVLIDNVAHARSLGAQSPAETAGKTDYNFFPAELARKFHADEQALLHSGLSYEGEETIPDRSLGQTRWLRTTKVPLRDSAGRVIGLAGINRDITERKEWEMKLDVLHKQLVEASRRAGMAEVATSVLHNVGNVLNSVNTSSGVIIDQVRRSQVQSVRRVADLLHQHNGNLVEFLSQDGRSNQLRMYLQSLADQLATEQSTVLAEAQELARNIEHIKEIVAMQQSYARVSGVIELQSVFELIEDALRMHRAGFERHHVRVVREFQPMPPVPLDKHKVLQILVNLISNAKYALADSDASERVLTVGASLDGDQRLCIFVADNGVGIAPEDLIRVFSHGFTTRPDGHGFGLHSGALAAREMGGSLVAHSAGLGEGARFTLALPLDLKAKSPVLC